MKIASLQLQLAIPANTPARQWRSWILDHLKGHGEPLRWAITSLMDSPEAGSQVVIEAVMIQDEA